LRGARVDNKGEVYEVLSNVQTINVGAESFNKLTVQQNPDGTYSVEVEDGINLLSLETWHTKIDSIPDNVFIRNPSQRKNALKEKFEEVFEELEEAQEEMEEGEADEAEEHYREAAEKLVNDILKKLDADGKADWVKEPTLINEVKSFIGFLNGTLT
jgi:RNAse (barnase) inhibitor barstar